MIVHVNNTSVEVAQDATVETLLADLGYPDRGIAVALDHAVLPKSQWNAALTEGARLDVVTAVQGG